MARHDTKLLDRRVVPKGQEIFREGAQALCAYFVESGEVEIYLTVRESEGKTRQVLGRVGQGGIFGEMGLVDDEPRMASARTSEDSVLVLVGREAFRQKLAKADPFIRGLLTIFARNIRALTRSR
ncbi:MAG: cyclic nucleotide-binding domain-containing protein [Acetobacterales bacterium]